MDETKMGLRIPNFYRLKDGDYSKLQLEIERGRVLPNSYVYDISFHRLIFINDDKSYNFITGGESGDQIFTTLTGTTTSPIELEALGNGMFIVQGNYSIKNTDVDHVAKTPIMMLAEVDAEDSNIRNVSVYTSNGCTVYKIEPEKTTINKMVTEQTVMEVVQDTVGEQIQEVVEEKIEDNIRPATDDEINEVIDSLFPDNPQGGD